MWVPPVNSVLESKIHFPTWRVKAVYWAVRLLHSIPLHLYRLLFWYSIMNWGIWRVVSCICVGIPGRKFDTIISTAPFLPYTYQVCPCCFCIVGSHCPLVGVEVTLPISTSSMYQEIYPIGSILDQTDMHLLSHHCDTPTATSYRSIQIPRILHYFPIEIYSVYCTPQHWGMFMIWLDHTLNTYVMLLIPFGGNIMLTIYSPCQYCVFILQWD